MTSRGLFVGKCAPFHLGHQYVIERALAECNEVCVFIYNSAEFDDEHPKLDKIIRAHWVKTIYPEIDVRVGYNPPLDEDSYEGDMAHAAFINKHLPWIPTRVYGGEGWVDNLAEFWEADPVRTDRHAELISASKIRSNPSLYSEYMNPIVRDWMLINYRSKLPLLPD